MEENKPKRVRRTKEQIEADNLTSATNDVQKLPTRKKREKKKKKVVKEGDLVPANYDDSYMITKKQREDCYVYAVQRVNFDPTLGRAEEGKEQLICFRQAQVHKAAIWVDGEIEVNVRERQLKIEYGAANVKLVNDPYEYE